MTNTWNKCQFILFALISPKFAQILKYFAQSCDCMIATFRNSGSRKMETVKSVSDSQDNHSLSINESVGQSVSQSNRLAIQVAKSEFFQQLNFFKKWVFLRTLFFNFRVFSRNKLFQDRIISTVEYWLRDVV